MDDEEMLRHERDIPAALGRLIRGGWLRTGYATAPRNFYEMPAPLEFIPRAYPSHPSLRMLLDENPCYVPDICDRVFSDEASMEQDEFLLRFFEGTLSEEEEGMFRLFRDNLKPTEGKMGLPNYLGRICYSYQMAFVDLIVLLGAYVLYCAEKNGILSTGQEAVDAPWRVSVTYHPAAPQGLEERV